MISEGSHDTEDWRENSEKFSEEKIQRLLKIQLYHHIITLIIHIF